MTIFTEAMPNQGERRAAVLWQRWINGIASFDRRAARASSG
jgi:hypothetical protein